jgi:hypothetical protein
VGKSRPIEVRQKISKALKGGKKNYESWLKNKKGPDHPAYKHGLGKTRYYNSSLYNAWIEGVHQVFHYQCFVTKKKNP